MSPQAGLYTKENADADIAVHAAILDAHTRNVLQTIRTGEYYTHIYGYHDPKALLAGRIYATILVVVRDMTVDRLGIDITTESAGDSARLGIYNVGTNLYPGTLLVDTGAVSINATGVVVATISQSLPKGIYFCAIIPEANCSIRAQLTYRGYIPILGIDGTTSFVTLSGTWRKTQAYGALPDPFPAGAAMEAGTALSILPRVASLD